MAKISSLVLFVDEQQYARDHVKDAKTPFLIVTASNDTTVSNSATRQIFEQVKNSKNRMIELDADHVTISFEETVCTEHIEALIEYFDFVIGPKRPASGEQLI